MSQPVNVPAAFAPPAGSERVRLARLARDAALRAPGVVGTDTGVNGVFVTVGGGERLEGVICAATNHGGYELSLRLVCELVPLVVLGEEVKAAVQRAATLAGIGVDSVSVHVAAVVGPSEDS
ncbi:MAG: hypothetical protein M3022_15255 [Actinomycetota bacterium]|nr:hypothetical protein [Actinomycetota bacterium]